jgi:hypothetical protein
MIRPALFGIGVTVIALAGCGPLMDLRDSIGPLKPGPMTPYGQLKRDFWGNTYLEPYRSSPSEPPRHEPDGQ